MPSAKKGQGKKGIWLLSILFVILYLRIKKIVSSLNFGVTRRWRPKSLDLGVSSLCILTPKSKDLRRQPYLNLKEDTKIIHF